MMISPEPKAGFIFTFFTTGFMAQDLLMALILGFIGAAGGYAFKILKDLVLKHKKQRVSLKILEKIYISLFIHIERNLTIYNSQSYYEKRRIKGLS